MKKIFIYIAIALAAVTLSGACQKDEPDTSKSIISVGNTYKTELDEWLEANYLLPYNINFQYRYLIKEADVSYYTIPADYNNSVIMAHLLKHLCIDTYDEIAGITFTRTYFPKMFFLIGEWEYNPNSTIVLGTAEGGKKILLSGINHLGSYMTSAANLNHYYIKTIHHEFTHILNQTKPYSSEFKNISAEDYVADDWNSYSDAQARQRGFITAYAQREDVEDFAEMMSEYVTNSAETWASRMTAAGDGASIIEKKLEVVKKYMTDSYKIDMDKLRAIILRRQDEVLSGAVDLTDCSVNY